MLHHRLQGNGLKVIYLDNPVGSFDDLLQVVCRDLGMDPAAAPDRDMISELRRLLAAGKDVQGRVVLIVDEAEKLFLATLERLLRAICDDGEDPVRLQVLLVGRPALNANLDQLTVYCSDVDIKGGYVLEPLTGEETARYLKFRMMAAGLPPDSREEIFTAGAVDKIFEASGGSLCLINILAEEALRNASTDKSFLVLLDHVAVADQSDKSEKKTISLLIPVALPKKKLLLPAGGALAILLLVLLFGGGGDEEQGNTGAGVDPPAITAPVPRPPAAPVVEQAEPVVVAPADRPAERQPPVAVSEPALSAEQPLVELQPDGIVELEASRVKSLPASSDKIVPVSVGPEQDQPAGAGSVSAGPPAPTGRDGEQLYLERLRASAKWLAGTYRNSYTVQLMMLASEQAVPNVKKMLVQDEYFALKDNFYILRKKTSPPTLFVFYGAYDSMEQARQARNNMPLFLRKHHPYALSISDAVKKTED